MVFILVTGPCRAGDLPLPSSPRVVERALAISGAEFAPKDIAATQPFSNLHVGKYGDAYWYEGISDPAHPNAKSFTFLFHRGWRTIKIPIRWERIQRSLSGPLDPAELSRLTATLDQAHAAGLRVILDLHNYGLYYLDGSQTVPRGRSNVGYRQALGTPQLPIEAFADLWSRLTRAVGSHPAIIGFHLMNEPQQAGGLTRATYYRATQAAVSAIRALNSTVSIRVGGWMWSDCFEWAAENPAPWITDPTGHTLYEAHHYWSEANDGDYTTYDAAVADARARGYTAGAYPDALYSRVFAELHGFTAWCTQHGVTGVIGENSWPNQVDAARWNLLGKSYYAECDRLGLAVDSWSAGEAYDKGSDMLSIYFASAGIDTGLDGIYPQATVMESHLSPPPPSALHLPRWTPPPPLPRVSAPPKVPDKDR